MAARPFILPLFEPNTNPPEFTGHVIVQAEAISGLYVHRSHREWLTGWIVSLPSGIRVSPERYPNRKAARAVARELSPLIPSEVKSGKWDGPTWRANDPEGAERMRSALSDLTGRNVKWNR